MKDTDAGRVFRSEFGRILAGKDKRAGVARRLLYYECPTTKEPRSEFLSLGRGERGAKDNGVFLMGATADEHTEWDGGGGEQDNPQHRVRLSHFRLHRFCVRNIEYELFDVRHFKYLMAPEQDVNWAQYPVVHVSWYDAICFAIWLGEKELEGELYQITLPSEAQWEYACRCGEVTPFTWKLERNGLTIEPECCCYNGYDRRMPDDNFFSIMTRLQYRSLVTVEDRESNPWGFYQLHGNVWEWCRDWYVQDYYRRMIAAEANDPLAPSNAQGSAYRVKRGGAFTSHGAECRSAYRHSEMPDHRRADIGIRLAAEP